MPLGPLMDFKGPKHKLLIGPSAITLVVVLLLNILPIACSSSGSTPPGAQNSYTTSFPLTENPISERGNWINGGTVGLHWKNVRATPGLAFGTESGSGGFDDSIAVLVGNWIPNQMAQAVVHTVNQNSNVFEEVELLLRTAIAPHNITGYEINFRCVSDGSQYVQIVRWNGPLGQFTYVNTLSGGPGLHEGDVIKATIIGSTITAYINGTMVLQGTESTYTSGNPGIGFYLKGAKGVNGDYGFTNFTATEAPITN